MPMPPYPIYCYTSGCKNVATYKIAGRWSDGLQSELKTYSLCCEECLPKAFQATRERQKIARPAPGETLEAAGVYRLQRGQRDQKLERLPEIEAKLQMP